MKTELDFKQVLKRGYIRNELEYERLLIVYRKLNKLTKKDLELVNSISLLKKLILDYEKKVWGKENLVTENKIKESDTATWIAEQERLFLNNRKNLIRKKLSEFKINQQDLGLILGHPKSYISELINGVRPFSQKDLIVIHKLFGIQLEELIPTILPEDERKKISMSISGLKKPVFHAQLKKLRKLDIAALLI